MPTVTRAPAEGSCSARSSSFPPACLDAAAGQAARRHRRRADDRACLAPRHGGRASAGSWSPPTPRRSWRRSQGRRRGRDDARRPPLRLRPHLRGGQPVDPEGDDIIVNVQGDLPTIEPRDRPRGLAPLADEGVDIATLAAVITRAEERANPNVGQGGRHADRRPGRLRALYFTRATAPCGEGPLYHHIGLYAYRRTALERFVVAAALAARAARAAGAAARARGRHAHRRRAR